jgi:cell division protein FtsN
MPKDYAKSKNGKKKSGASRGKKKGSAPVALMTVTFLLAAALISLLVYLKWFQNPVIDPIGKSEVKTNPKQVTPAAQTDSTDSDKTIEEDDEVPFYKTHEEMVNNTVEIPIEDLKLPEDENKYVYIMPCGSFREISRAEELEAQVALAGYESKVNQVTVESGVWYRVELGPFKSKRRAESIRHRLQDNGLNYCKIWPKKVK